jgi:hypothetical protein
MNSKVCFRVMALCAGFILVLFLAPAVVYGQMPGDSVVLAKCNSWVSFTLNSNCGDVVIKNIGNHSHEKARVDVTIGYNTKSECISHRGKISLHGFSDTTFFQVVNIERGISKSDCSLYGPVDSDVMVFIPENATQVSSGNLVEDSCCSVCRARFKMKAETVEFLPIVSAMPW